MSSHPLPFDAAFINIPEKPIYIAPAGQGVEGKVYFCLPYAALPPSKAPLDFRALRQQLVAVKILNNRNTLNSSQHEVDVQSRISAHPSYSTVEKHLRTILDWDKEPVTPGECKWFSMQAVYPAISVSNTYDMLRDRSMKISVQIVAHMFLQIGTVLRVLHNEMNMVHNDVHTGNVLIDIDSVEDCGLPNFVLIDFGKARDSKNATWKPEWAKSDTAGFCGLFDKLQSVTDIASLTVEQADRWERFKQLAEAMSPTSLQPRRDQVMLEEIWTAYEDAMRRIRDDASSEAVVDAKKILQTVFDSTGTNIPDTVLSAAIQGARSS